MLFWRRILGLECAYLHSEYCKVPRGEGCKRNVAENYFEIGVDAGCYREAEERKRGIRQEKQRVLNELESANPFSKSSTSIGI